MRYFPSLLIVCAIFATAGCQHRVVQDNDGSSTTAATPAKKGATDARGRRTDGQEAMSEDGKVKGQIYGTPHKGSKFTNLRIGMSRARVESLIGQGTDTKSYTTGKAWAPFYYGADRYRVEHFYKGSGRLAFSSNNRLVVIVHDASEDGYND